MMYLTIKSVFTMYLHDYIYMIECVIITQCIEKYGRSERGIYKWG